MFPFFLLVLIAQLDYVVSDLPIHCLHYQIVGKWKIEISELGREINECGYPHPDRNSAHFLSNYDYEITPKETMFLDLIRPNKVFEQNREIGTWTMVYDEGFHIKLHKNRLSLFAFMKYEPTNKYLLTDEISDYISYCDTSRIGWVRSSSQNLNGCFRGKKVFRRSFLVQSISLSHQSHSKKKKNNRRLGRVSRISYANDDAIFRPNYAFIETINNDKTQTWKATVHKQFIGKTIKEMSALLGRHHFSPIISEIKKSVKKEPGNSFIQTSSNSWISGQYPVSLDWRNISGINYLNEVKNQGNCGSCYALASLDAIATRFKIHLQKHNSLQKLEKSIDKLEFSPQDVLSCSSKNQGCSGGYPYLVAQYGKDIGFTTESCSEYTGHDVTKCSNAKVNCPFAKRYKIKDYNYVGGYYGGCNEQSMIKELQNGPIIIAFQAQTSLFSYLSGVYHCDSPPDEENQIGEKGFPNWQKTTHAVVGVGYGVTKINGKDVPYWLIKNSWGAEWGMDGYFKVRRGDNTCAIETMAVSAIPDI